MFLQLQLKDSITIIIGREEHGLTVFSEEILYGYLLCLPFIRCCYLFWLLSDCNHVITVIQHFVVQREDMCSIGLKCTVIDLLHFRLKKYS